ncbi:hypothetical protein [Halogeometricum limi]|uniref:Uncharacterized protein n=1 Tax=Halogeometricum limi TaxID=555875 RepID=A0A1I6GSL8_9EURY|nr:hypothetical protein [Halogeometricum limi]SFR45222.1 hypothetical protein SAMN04488124_1483 [Halogeometricum limi]
MSSLPHTSPRLVVGVGSLLLTVLATYVAASAPGFPGRVWTWPYTFLVRLRRDLPRGDRVTLAWVAVALWSVGVTALHFGGLRYRIYTQYPWWDLLTHSMGGLGVAAVLAMSYRRPGDAARSPWWLIPGVLAIGAGFEVYEFVFKTFWYGWTFEFYVVDTVIDLCINTSGAVVVAVALSWYQNEAETNARASDAGDGPSGGEFPE